MKLVEQLIGEMRAGGVSLKDTRLYVPMNRFTNEPLIEIDEISMLTKLSHDSIRKLGRKGFIAPVIKFDLPFEGCDDGSVDRLLKDKYREFILALLEQPDDVVNRQYYG